MSGREFAFKTTRSSHDKNGWRLRLSCSGEGDKYTLDVRWRVLKNGRLRETIKGKTVEYERCSGYRRAAIADRRKGHPIRAGYAQGICSEMYRVF
jgi:hypothetical protein